MTVLDTSPLEARRSQIRNQAEQLLLNAAAQGRRTLNQGEQARYDAMMAEARDLSEDLERRSQINSTVGGLSARLPGVGGARTNDRDLTYRRHGRDSWVRDLVLSQVGYDASGECRRRLGQHAQEVATHGTFQEYRDLSRTDGAGGYAVPPAWLVDQYVELARPSRPLADLVTRLPLPGGTDTINVPKMLTGTSVAVQVADNTTVSETDITDTFVSCPVRTIAGQQSIAIQLLDQSPVAFDDIIFRDLVAAHGAATDVQVITGTGTNGQVLGIHNTAGIQTVTVGALTIAGFYAAIANAIQLVHSSRFLPPTVVVMHPRRWGWLCSLLDTTNRPLIVPNSQAPMNSAGAFDVVASQQVVGSVQGVPIVTDPNLATNLGAGTNQDYVYVLRASDLVLYESGLRARVLPETKAETLTVLVQLYGYLGFTAGRQPAAVVEVQGFTPPSF